MSNDDCKHDHDHHHHHHHDENCDCGCHDQDHIENSDVLYTEDSVSPVVCSIEKNFNLEDKIPSPELEEIYLQRVNALASWINEKGGLIGHLKLYICSSETGGELWLSCAGANTTSKQSTIWKSSELISNYSLGFTAIVFGVNEEELFLAVQMFSSTNIVTSK